MQMATFWRFLRAVFSASRAERVSDLNSKFTLRPHHAWKYVRHPISDRRGKKKKEKEETCLHNIVNFGPLAADIVSLVWGTP